MAEKAEKKSEAKKQDAAAGAATAAPAEAVPAKKGKLFGKTPVLLGGVMVIEAAMLFAGFKMFGGGAKHAQGADLTQADAKPEHGEGHADAEHGEAEHGASAEGGAAAPKADENADVELKIVEFKAINRQSGHTTLYDVKLCLVTSGKNKERVERLLHEREGLIQDRVRTIIAQSDPEKLGEPGMETLRRQVKYSLDQMLDDDKSIKEVLVPRCIPYRTDF